MSDSDTIRGRTLFDALLTEQIAEAMVGLNSGQPSQKTL